MGHRCKRGRQELRRMCRRRGRVVAHATRATRKQQTRGWREETLMLKKMIVGGVIGIAALAGTAGTSHAGVSVDLGIHLGAPAPLARAPASPGSCAPCVSADRGSYDGR